MELIKSIDRSIFRMDSLDFGMDSHLKKITKTDRHFNPSFIYINYFTGLCIVSGFLQCNTMHNIIQS